MKYRLGIVSVIALMGGIFLSVSYVNPYSGEISLSEVILQLSGARGNLCLGFSLTELTGLALSMVPDFIFEMYMGLHIYQSFCVASVYLFSRCVNKRKWYFFETVRLLGSVLLFQFLMLGVVIVVTGIRYRLAIAPEDFRLLFYEAGIRGGWIYSMTMLINILSIFAGSHIAYSVVMGFQYGALSVLTLLGPIPGQKGITISDVNILWVNPMSHLVLCWHKDMDKIMENHKDWMEQISLSFSLFLIFIVSFFVFVIGLWIIERRSILISQAEEGNN